MSYSYAVRREIYLSWKPVFSLGNNAQLRKRAKIADLVRRYAPASHRFWHPNLVSILQSLLEQNVFFSEFIARRAFPDIYGTDKEVNSAPVIQAHTGDVSDPTGSREPMDELKSSLQKLYQSRLYSDLKIVCRGNEYHVHKAIICTRSDFFAKACRAGFKEQLEGEIDLSNDNPAAVASMVHYFYYLDYTPVVPDNSDGAIVVEESQALLTDDATKLETTSSMRAGAGLLYHAQVYALAERYTVKGLKSLALQKFRDSAQRTDDEGWVQGFLAAAEEAFTSTIETDRGLRNIVLQTFHRHPELLDEERTQNLLKELSCLTFDLLMYERRANAPECWEA